MPSHGILKTRECVWCKRSIGAKARVCPYCFRGQGLWIVLTSIPTWVTAVIAVAAATIAVLQPDGAEIEQRHTSMQEAAPSRPAATGPSMADVHRVVEGARTSDQQRLDDLELRLAEIAAAIAAIPAIEEDTPASGAGAAQALGALNARMNRTDKQFDEMREQLDRYRDSFALRDIDRRIERVDSGYFDAKAECLDESAACAASRTDVVSIFDSLSSAVESYRGEVTSVSHGIMVRNTCAKGRLLSDWSDGHIAEFSWFRKNCA